MLLGTSLWFLHWGNQTGFFWIFWTQHISLSSPSTAQAQPFILLTCSYSPLWGSLGARPMWQAGALTPKVLKEKPATTCGEMGPPSDTQLSWGVLLRRHWVQQPGTQPWAYQGGLEFSVKLSNVTAPSLHADTLTLLVPAQGYCTSEAQYSGNLSMPPSLHTVLPIPALTRCKTGLHCSGVLHVMN